MTGDIPVKVPIPDRLFEIPDRERRSAAMKEWWTAYATRYPEYRAADKDNHYVYMKKRGGD
ncbi:hypothetical protein [Brevibacillus choshinensis]|uniref:hypothetical protein n=1 Tax=Brevibacillus choshinensis TaxID=54911 RepID=UPI002E1F4E90|nr:hypothetical protein [Brevibacillus choshinensis]